MLPVLGGPRACDEVIFVARLRVFGLERDFQSLHWFQTEAGAFKVLSGGWEIIRIGPQYTHDTHAITCREHPF